jgi:hypothetical protein
VYKLAKIKNMINYIQGEKFYQVADFLYSPNIKPEFDDYNIIQNTYNKNKLSGNLDIIYTHTLYVKHLFNEIKDLKQKFIIVTHNSDINIDSSFIIPDNVIKWYAQNVDVINDKIESIPIGHPNNRWFPHMRKLEKLRNKLNEIKKHKNLLYLNHTIKTNPKERKEPYDLLQNKSWVSLIYGTNGVDYDRYIDDIYNHKFVLCPAGNGIDTHRLWEVLDLKSIPVVKKHINNLYYKDLPICFVDSWNDITEEFLEKEYDRINKIEWDLSKLNFDYWKNKITNVNTKRIR